MSGKAAGKKKPLKQKKAGEKVLTEDDKAFLAKKKADEKALKDAQQKLAAGKKKK